MATPFFAVTLTEAGAGDWIAAMPVNIRFDLDSSSSAGIATCTCTAALPCLPSDAALIVTVPPAIARTVPDASTVATSASVLVHVTGRVNVLPCASRGEARQSTRLADRQLDGLGHDRD